MHCVFWGVENMWKGFFLTWTSLRCLRIMFAQQRYGAPECREQSEWQKRGEKQPELLSLTLLGKPVCCEIVDWVWVSLWTGLNPSDVTLIKFKIYNQQSGNFCSVSPWGIAGQCLKQINLCSNAVFALNLQLSFPGDHGRFNSGLCVHLYISKC